MKKRIIIIASISIIIIAITLIILVRPNSTDNQVVETGDNSTQVTIEVQEKFDNLKENLGKGTNGDVTSVKESSNDNGEKQYVYTYKDGSTQTITVRDAKNVIEKFDDGDSNRNNNVIDDEDSNDIEKEPGTVYEQFLLMSPEEQYKFCLTFESQEEYMKWYQQAQAEYVSLHPTIEIGENQVIDFGQ